MPWRGVIINEKNNIEENYPTDYEAEEEKK